MSIFEGLNLDTFPILIGIIFLIFGVLLLVIGPQNTHRRAVYRFQDDAIPARNVSESDGWFSSTIINVFISRGP